MRRCAGFVAPRLGAVLTVCDASILADLPPRAVTPRPSRHSCFSPRHALIFALLTVLKKLLQIDNCTGLALPALRLAQLARKTSSETQFDLQKAKLTLLTKADSERARAAEEKIKAFLEDEYPDAFRLGTETHSQMLRLEVLAQLVIELVSPCPRSFSLQTAHRSARPTDPRPGKAK